MVVLIQNARTSAPVFVTSLSKSVDLIGLSATRAKGWICANKLLICRITTAARVRIAERKMPEYN